MFRFTRPALVICFIAVLTVSPLFSYAMAADMAPEEHETSLAEVSVDLLALRPLGAVSTLLGLVGYVVSLPFSIPCDNDDVVWESIVEKPVDYTFKRPIGEF